ncbi:BTB/POZ domain-containing protein 17 [Trichinella pseudospiralis]|uniref:BTB/POZ domain-containing protein 17 n=1 Tax=Trichinella pseudospiralis TaxID=6337 RepID=A0A0V0Y8N7_TRIPS|nr:BTB/POZ domain-containing protein 17 [Trichinella pseudospiralis]
MSSYHLKRKKISVKRKKNRQKTNCLSNSGSTIASANTTASIKLVAATAVSHNSWLKLKLFRTHKIVLARSSDVFERMISKEWCGDGMIEIELIEDRECVEVFGIFLRFLYCNHIKLRAEDSLAVLTLADKYNVVNLRKVCLNFVISRIIPQLTLKEVFHVWFQYGTKCFHQALVKTCVDRLATQFQDIISGQEWEKEWLLLDKDQMNEFLRTSELTVASEYEIWLAVFRWIQNLIQSEKRSSVSVERILGAVLPNIRFPMMTADELNQVEKLPFVEQHAKYFQPYLMMSYKYRALPLISRAASREFCGSQFLLRNYTRLRWDKRFVIADFSSLPRYSEISFKPWDWELKLHPKGVSGNCDEFKCVLVSSVMLDQSRAVEYMLSIVNDKMILRSIVGKKIFSKSRYGSDLELEKRVAVDEVLMENSPLLINDTMVLQLTLRPIE